jgi:hypothetical protein
MRPSLFCRLCNFLLSTHSVHCLLLLVLLYSLHPPFMFDAFRRLMTHLFHFAKVGTWVLPFASHYDMSPFSLEDVSLACLLPTRGFILWLDACVPTDLQALVVWLVGTPVLLPMLLLVFLAQSPLPCVMGMRLYFSYGFLLLFVLLSSCCASGLCAFLCWTMIHRCTHPNILHLMRCCCLGFS